MKLTDRAIKTGQTVEIVEFSGAESMRERLHEMGLRQGSQIFILGQAPFSGPLLVRFHQSFLALRNEEAQCITVK
jgi:ferrous iron transport protein A